MPAATGKSQQSYAIADTFHERLTLEATRQNVDRVTHPRETLREFQHVNYLPACVRQTELGLCGDITVGRNHHDAIFLQTHE
jgi:hypothetical protein